MPNRENIKPHQWKKGQSGNPEGRPRLLVSSVIEQMKSKGVESISQYDIKATFLMLLNLEIPELESMVKDKDQPVLVRIVGKEMLGGKGFDVIEKMLDRAIGRPDSKIDHTTKGRSINQTAIDYSKFSDEELRTIAELQRKGSIEPSRD